MSIKSMIAGQDSIQALFSILHDGVICGHRVTDGSLCLKVEIEYLTKTIDPTFRFLLVTLIAPKKLRFTPWPKPGQENAQVLVDPAEIFLPPLEILEGELAAGEIVVHCALPPLKYDYSGGQLRFTASSATVADESETNYTLPELATIAQRYWDSWDRLRK